MFLVTLLVLKTNLNTETRTEKKEEWKIYCTYTHIRREIKNKTRNKQNDRNSK